MHCTKAVWTLDIEALFLFCHFSSTRVLQFFLLLAPKEVSENSTLEQTLFFIELIVTFMKSINIVFLVFVTRSVNVGFTKYLPVKGGRKHRRIHLIHIIIILAVPYEGEICIFARLNCMWDGRLGLNCLITKRPIDTIVPSVFIRNGMSSIIGLLLLLFSLNASFFFFFLLLCLLSEASKHVDEDGAADELADELNQLSDQDQLAVFLHL